ncbi:MAG TPA: hypothetical protein VFC58_07910 [Desulfosporosinus sp.]|nr:hypothetical protein [Desulfosporosinus sp.]
MKNNNSQLYIVIEIDNNLHLVNYLLNKPQGELKGSPCGCVSREIVGRPARGYARRDQR